MTTNVKEERLNLYFYQLSSETLKILREIFRSFRKERKEKEKKGQQVIFKRIRMVSSAGIMCSFRDGGGGADSPWEMSPATLRATAQARLLWGIEIGKELIQQEFWQQVAGNCLADLETIWFLKEERTKTNTVKDL